VPELLLDVRIPGAESENLHDALDDVAAYSLVTRDAEGPFFLVHRLVQDVTRRSLNIDRRQQSLAEALGWINNSFPDAPSDARSWPRAEALVPHVRTLLIHADGAAIVGLTARLMNQLGMLLASKALYAEAGPLYQRCLAINEKALGPDHVQVGTVLNNLAELYHAQGRFAEAEPLNKRALGIRENALGADHPAVAVSLNNLSGLYQSQGRYAEAEPILRRSLAISEQALGSDHPTVATSLNNLGGLCQSQGRYAEAELLYRRSLQIRETALGSDHPYVGTSLSNLGELYRAQGRYTEAEPLHLRSLAIREKALGPNHDAVANGLNNLALLYSEMGQHEEAAVCMHRCLRILLSITRQIGRNHPYLELATMNYVDELRTLGNSESKIAAELERLRGVE
jgi:tetratricopeptide (TPR) repeat protein